MSKRLYVGNLSAETTTTSLTSALAADGRKIESVSIVMDRGREKSRGFAFVEMASEEDARGAIQALHGTQIDGRTLRVDTAIATKSRFGGKVGRSD